METLKIPVSKVKWAVQLSDGSEYREDFIYKHNSKNAKKSRWLELRDHLEKTGLVITSLWLIKGQNIFNLPIDGRNPKFKDFENIPPQIGFKFFRKVGSDAMSSEFDYFTVIEANYPKYRLQIWVDENTDNSWSVVKDN